MKHFIKETDFSHAELGELFALAANFKRLRKRHTPPALDRQSWGLLFFKKSTRTRVSFQVGVHELGGQPLMLNADDLQLSRGETVADTAKVLSRYIDGLVIRCFDHSLLEEFAETGTIPVVNALTDLLHPCQLYTDLFTLAERWAGDADLPGALRGRKVAFFGDTACNVANSWILGGALFGLEIALAGPKGFEPGEDVRQLLKEAGLAESFVFTHDPREAAEGADCLYTDVWVSMGKEEEAKQRVVQLNPYQVTKELLDAANPGACFMHCLPAHPGVEVAQEVLDDGRSIIFDQAENRLHMQKAILAALAQANE